MDSNTSTELPILKTKLHVPVCGPRLIRRNSLLTRLDQERCSGARIFLISAPAGYGKTTLVSEWLENSPAAWLSLDESDNDPTRFWLYTLSALQGVTPSMNASTVMALREPQAPPMELILTRVINDLSDQPDPVLLILDDYHQISSRISMIPWRS